ncbi:MAG: hypothetical protein DMD37_03005 [Gemmatimonadetes bacterium]|nr:MAG: hypothetical protein DMD74_11405 [Gemmatimonadota bacterium]PYO70618.1 MAG: hypothetical protein DMD71_01440 [Gemmatimonadota bacterium]PYO83349.1 MAG: hypothetical protein DMD68_09410 [Gemmatimonadota bacterium]PYP64289.1 MAG: hypothetical protein DMD37_03005 [Gemmatimonadota bacterium]
MSARSPSPGAAERSHQCRLSRCGPSAGWRAPRRPRPSARRSRGRSRPHAPRRRTAASPRRRRRPRRPARRPPAPPNRVRGHPEWPGRPQA